MFEVTAYFCLSPDTTPRI